MLVDTVGRCAFSPMDGFGGNPRGRQMKWGSTYVHSDAVRAETESVVLRLSLYYHAPRPNLSNDEMQMYPKYFFSILDALFLNILIRLSETEHIAALSSAIRR